STRSVLTPVPILYSERYTSMVRQSAWQVLASTAADQTANDRSEANDDSNSDEAAERPSDGEHSPFAMALFEELEGIASMPRNDGVIAATDLFQYLYGKLAGMIERKLLLKPQTPRLWSLPKHGLGEFVFRDPLRARGELPAAPDRSPYP